MIYHLFTELTLEISSLTLEEKLHVFTRPCMILYNHWTVDSAIHNWVLVGNKTHGFKEKGTCVNIPT